MAALPYSNSEETEMQRDKENRQAGLATLKEKEAATLLGLSVKTLRQWRWKGTGPDYLKLGNGRGAAIRYEVSALETFKDRSRISA